MWRRWLDVGVYIASFGPIAGILIGVALLRTPGVPSPVAVGVIIAGFLLPLLALGGARTVAARRALSRETFACGCGGKVPVPEEGRLERCLKCECLWLHIPGMELLKPHTCQPCRERKRREEINALPPTEDRGFLEALAAQPEDDSVRLIYADWLEERDDPRGEYLRITVALARLLVDDLHAEDLRWRADQLRQQIDPRWRALVEPGRPRKEEEIA
jgi:uncharacterized protein (TIGR02996 family)